MVYMAFLPGFVQRIDDHPASTLVSCEEFYGIIRCWCALSTW